MDLLDNLQAFFAPKTSESPAIEKAGSISAAIATMNRSHTAPPRRSIRNLLAAYSEVPALRKVVQRIANGVASAQWKVARIPGGSRRDRRELMAKLRSATYSKGEDNIHARTRLIKSLHDENELEEIEGGHPVLDLMQSGNVQLLGGQVRHIIEVLLCLAGEVFIIVEMTNSGQPGELVPIPPHWLERRPTLRDPFWLFNDGFGFKTKVEAERVIWMKDVDPLDPYGPGTGIGRTLGTELDIDEFAARTLSHAFFNKGKPELLISFENQDPAAVEAHKIDWLNRVRGWMRTGIPHFTNAKIDVKELSSKIIDLDLSTLRGDTSDQIRESFGVPPELVGEIENSNRATIDGAELIHARYVLEPRLVFQEEQWNEKLVPMFPNSEGVVLFFVSPVPEDRVFVKDVIQVAPYAFKVNEIRQTAGFAKLDQDQGEVMGVPFGIELVSPEEFGSGHEDDEDEETEDEPFIEIVDDEEDDDNDDNTDHDDDERAIELALGEWIDHVKAPEDKPSSDGDIEAVAAIVDSANYRTSITRAFNAGLPNWLSSLQTDLGVDLESDVLRQIQSDAIEETGDRVETWAAFTRNRIRKQLRQGIDAGESVDQLADRITSVTRTVGRSRAKVIAETEVTRAANKAAIDLYEVAGVEQAEWLTQRDGRVRDSHIPMDGQTQTVGGLFRSALGNEARFPGGFGVAADDVNCRCRVAPKVLTKGDRDRRAIMWRAFDRRVIPWEKRTRRSVEKAFRDNEAALIREVRRRFGSKRSLQVV